MSLSKRRPVVAIVVLLAATQLSCEDIGLAPEPIAADEAVLLAAGDIASCLSGGDERTADLLDQLPGTIAALGDDVYERGLALEYDLCYAPSWGRHRERTRPVPGNHDYGVRGAGPYYAYFGAAAGERGAGYYSYDLGAWHIVALNSEVAHGAGSAQEQWLRADLAAHPARCTLAYAHRPRFSSGAEHGSDAAMQPLWQALYDAGGDVVLAGHDHDYERFAPQGPAGTKDAERGLREFVVGTGGRGLRSFGAVAPNSEVRFAGELGILELRLKPEGYTWRFHPVAGSFRDEGAGACH